MTDAVKVSEDTYATRRAALSTFIDEHLVEGVDYGRIHSATGSSGCVHKAMPVFCKDPSHWSRQILLKPGAEKLCEFYDAVSSFTRDTESWELVGRTTDRLLFVCTLRKRWGDKEFLGEGRGACEITVEGGRGRPRDLNAAMKIAEKRAHVDAVLRTFALSERFSQDLDDQTDAVVALPKDRPTVVAAPPKIVPVAPPAKVVTRVTPMASPRQLSLIRSLEGDPARLDAACRERFGVSVQGLTLFQASELIDFLKARSRMAI